MNYFICLYLIILKYRATPRPRYVWLSTLPIVPVSQASFTGYSWLNDCCNCTLVVVSFTYSTVDFISSRKDLFYSSIRDKLLSQFSTNRHSSIDNLNYCLHLVQGTSHTMQKDHIQEAEAHAYRFIQHYNKQANNMDNVLQGCL